MIWPFNRGRVIPPPPSVNWQNEVLLDFGRGDVVTVNEACAGIICLGETGAGKSSAMLSLLKEFIRRGFGFVMLPAKSSDYGKLLKVVREAGREHEFFVFGQGQPFIFDVVKYELDQGSPLESVAGLLTRLMEVGQRGVSGNSAGDNPFFILSSSRLMMMLLCTVYLGTGSASMQDLARALATAPQCYEDLHGERNFEWLKGALAGYLMQAHVRCTSANDLALLYEVEAYWEEYAVLDSKTRSNIVACVTNTFSKLLASPTGRLVCGPGYNLSPDDVLNHQRILYINAPVLRDREAGSLVLTAWKLCYQRAALRRVVNDATKPCVLWCDEFQYVITSDDVLTATVTRESRLIQVFLTQTLPVLEQSLGGGPKARTEVEALFGNLATKFICNVGGCKTTSEFVAEMFGKSWKTITGGSFDSSSYNLVDDVLLGNSIKHNFNFNRQWHYDVSPADLGRLR